MGDRVLVVGAGQAGLVVAQSLRERGHTGEIVLVGDEPHAPYQRPPLSKKFLSGEIGPDRLALKPPAFYEKAAVDLRLGARIGAIDLGRGRAEHEGGTIAFDRLVFATGTRARALSLPGAEAANIRTLRSIADVDGLRPMLGAGRRIVIIGGGYIGLEVAAVARQLGADVTVIEAQPRVLARVVAEPLSRFYEALHRRNGVRLFTGSGLSAISPDGREVVTQDGLCHPADLVLAAIGAVANTELAASAGLTVDDGIVVDAAGRTSHAGAFAAGDCTRFLLPRYGRTVRLESVQNAIDQAKHVAATMTGSDAVYDPVPWFWSDQYDVKLQIAGLSQGHDTAVTRGDLKSAEFSVFYLREQRLLAVDSVNRPRDHMLARRVLGKPLLAQADRLADPGQAWDALFAA